MPQCALDRREPKEGRSAGCADTGTAGRIDPKLLCPVKHRSAQAQADLTVIRARAGLVRARTVLVNTARGLAKLYGERLRGCNVRNMNAEKAQGLSPELRTALQPLLAGISRLSERIRECNEGIEKLARESYPQVAQLKQVKGVGTLIALTFLRTWKTRIAFAKVATWAATWGSNRDEETRATASRRCTSARKAILIREPCWCRARTTSWGRLEPTAICAAGV